MASLISRILPSWSSSCLCLFLSFLILHHFVFYITDSLFSLFILAVRASILYCISVREFFISTWLDFSSFISPVRNYLLSSMLFSSPAGTFIILVLNSCSNILHPYQLNPWQWVLSLVLSSGVSFPSCHYVQKRIDKRERKYKNSNSDTRKIYTKQIRREQKQTNIQTKRVKWKKLNRTIN